MFEIAIIGAGQLGSRHLQALAGLDGNYRITVVEGAAASVERARGRWSEVAKPSSPEVVWTADVAALPPALDVAIVATAADVRRAVIERMLTVTRIRHLVLEKVLFQRVADYAPSERAIADATTTAWVNCPRRLWAFYSSLRARLAGPLRMTVTGSAWGLGSSTVHFLDLFAFLGGGDAQKLDSLHVRAIASTRPGYQELVGEVAGHADGGSFALASLAEGQLPIVVEVATPSLRAIVRESEGKAWVATAADSWRWQEATVETLPQSRLSHRFVEDLVATGRCGLTPLAASVQHHLAFLGPLAQTLGVDVCPIT